jgi:transcriptional regulator
MYVPKYFAETDVGRLHQLIEEYSFGTLICPQPSGALEIAHLPFMLDRDRGPQGTLMAHVACANSIWQTFNETHHAVTIFQGPNGYISSSWYTSCDDVPTWNYAVVHVYGRPRLTGEAELSALLDRLVDTHERRSRTTWSTAEVPEEALTGMKSQILSFEIEITELVGKFKLGQNRSPADRAGAVAGLRARANPLDGELARFMEETFRE